MLHFPKIGKNRKNRKMINICEITLLNVAKFTTRFRFCMKIQNIED